MMIARRLGRRDEDEPGMPGDPNAITSKIPNPEMVESFARQPGTRISVLGCGRARGYQRDHGPTSDSHTRHRSGAPPYRLGPDRERRQSVDSYRLRFA